MHVQQASSNKQCASSASPKGSYFVFLNSIDSLSCSGMRTYRNYTPGLKVAAEKQNASCFAMIPTERRLPISPITFLLPHNPYSFGLKICAISGPAWHIGVF